MSTLLPGLARAAAPEYRPVAHRASRVARREPRPSGVTGRVAGPVGFEDAPAPPSTTPRRPRAATTRESCALIMACRTARGPQALCATLPPYGARAGVTRAGAR